MPVFHLSKWKICKKCGNEFWGYTAELCFSCKQKKYSKRARLRKKVKKGVLE